jgi:hypothetical protein
MVDRSNIVRTWRWLRSGRGIRRVLIVLAWTVTVVALFYGEEDWRGRRAWNAYRKAAEGRGLSLEFRAYIPKPVPDEQNFAATPFLRTFLGPESGILTNDLWSRAVNHIYDIPHKKEMGHRHFTDLVAWQEAAVALERGKLRPDQSFETDKTDLNARAAAAPVVLEGMKPDMEVFRELRAASGRPYARFAVAYDEENPWTIIVPHLAKIKQLVQRLNLQACAELAAGSSDQALADVKLMLAVADSVKTEPMLISFLVRSACVQIAMQPVWEGLAEHRWTDAQLEELEARFLSYDFLTDAEKALKAERAIGTWTGDMAKRNGVSLLAELRNGDGTHSSGPGFLEVADWIAPSGWYDFEKLNYNRLFDVLLEGAIDPAERMVSPHRAASDAAEWDREVSIGSLGVVLRHRILASMMLAGLPKVALRVATHQVAADQAALACALERYRLANGQFPETMEELTPRYMAHLPNDVVTGQPYKYRRRADGQFVLYSVGWNEKDDGGVPGKVLFDQAQGDWVWEYPGE